jgi:hypothetical protein
MLLKSAILGSLVLALSLGCGGPTVSDSSKVQQSLTSKWEPILTCDNGAATIDVNTQERRNLQIVIKDKGIIDYLNRTGAVQSKFGAQEVIASGNTGWVDWKNSYGPRIGSQSGDGVFKPADFKELIAEHNYYDASFGRLARVAREGKGVVLQYGSFEKRGCAKEVPYCPGDGFPCSNSCVIDYSEFVEQANWHFRDCK